MASELVKHGAPGMELLAEMARKSNDPQAAIEIAKQVVELATRWESLNQSRDRFEWEKLERQARVSFAESFKKFKEDAPKILKTKHVHFPSRKEGSPDTSYWHVELDKACEVLIPALLKVGISHRWKSADLPGGATRVTCYLRNELGYEEEGASLAGPADQSGGKNPIQGVGSSTSYLERYTLLASLGLVATGNDDDGTGGIDNEAGAALVAAMLKASDMDALRAALKVAKMAALESRDYKVMKLIDEAWDRRKGELNA